MKYFLMILLLGGLAVIILKLTGVMKPREPEVMTYYNCDSIKIFKLFENQLESCWVYVQGDKRT